MALLTRLCTRPSSTKLVGTSLLPRQQLIGGDVTTSTPPITRRFPLILGGRAYISQTSRLHQSSSSKHFTTASSRNTPSRSALQPQSIPSRYASTSTTMPTAEPEPEKSMHTSGARDSVWVHKQPYSAYPKFSPLTSDLETDICIIGAGIAGISTAYELVKRGKNVVMIEARDVLSGETGRTSGHLTNDLDDGYLEIAKKHGKAGAKAAAQSHAWARDRIGEISKQLGIDCEYRKLPAYDVSQYPVGDKKHSQELKELKEEAEYQHELGIETRFDENLTVKGWSGKIDQRGGLVADNQATFHPTKYLSGVLEWLKQQHNFKCFTRTRAMSIEEKGVEILGIGHKSAVIQTEEGHTIKAEYAVEATCVPLQKLSIITQLEFYRSYCIAIRVPRGSVEDCLLYDNAEEYKYVRLTACDEVDDYMVVGGCDHKVGQEETMPRFAELETWTRERFPQAGKVDYRWSGQIFEPVDYMAFIGKNQGMDKIFVVTGDSGDGLTHGVLAGRLIADEIDGVENEWASLYSPKRIGSILKSLPSMVSHDLQINAQYKRFLQSDITDIEDLAKGSGGVLNPKTSKPVAIYKDENGKVTTFSALCPHLKGVVCWNAAEKSFDCPVHGSRFSKEGICVSGPAKANLSPEDEAGKTTQGTAVGAA
ncbi:FAD dependent oxidoreductase-domain-containing protein [Apodospora peruviana]|uniref:FAD dependent oxidoreductase-domain-containing protein n=1 Tax=Apodospora peruviana TaxID=516989 RepID=A0AAE0HX57_9PEZI|nr:FAD dependent oxidoreductase-domain-containing protein [Apodospora peruviana]